MTLSSFVLVLNRMSQSMRTSVAVLFSMAICVVNATSSMAQSPPADGTPPLSFEVASIKPSKPGTPGMMLRIQPGANFVGTGITAKFLLEEAYGVKDAQISQAPPWLDSERFDIDAKPEESVAAAMDKLPRDQRQAQLMQMIQSLLADRFKLVLGHETKELPVYVLIVAKNGPKLKVSTFKPPDKPGALPPLPKDGSAPPGGVWMRGPGNITVNGVDMPTFVRMFSRIVGRIVVDKTGLPGRYDFTLQWTPDDSQGPMPPGPPNGGPAGPPPTESSGPSLFTAIQEQLGLKLESQKAPMDVLVIKHVEKPSEN